MIKAFGFLLLLSLAASNDTILNTNDFGLYFKTSDQGSRAIYGVETKSDEDLTRTYSIMTWLYMEELPENEVPVVAIETNKLRHVIKLSKNKNGQIVAHVPLEEHQTFEKAVPSKGLPGVWEHIALTVCQKADTTWEAKICTTEWKGVPNCHAYGLPNKPVILRTEWTDAYLGGYRNVSVVGVLAGTTLSVTDCKTEDAIKNIVANTECASVCRGNCHGPSDHACNEFVMVRQAFPKVERPLAENKDFYKLEHPHMQGVKVDLDLGLTGWFHTKKGGWNNLFTIQNRYCDSGHNCRSLMMYYHPDKTFHMYDATNTVWGTAREFKYSKPIKTEWFFAAVSRCIDQGDKKSYMCVGMWEDTQLECFSYDTNPGEPERWGTSKDDNNNIFVGGNTWYKLDGGVADGRFYNKCLDPTDMNRIFRERKARCVPGCEGCSGVMECSDCDRGFYQS